MKRFLPYIFITLVFFIFLLIFHPKVFTYKFNPNLVHDYLRSQDIEDPKGLIKDRITVSDSNIYIATGYLYATGTDPTTYNFQHPPFIKYLFGFSTLLTGNPFWVQILFGLGLLCLTYFLGIKFFKSKIIAFAGFLFLLIDPVFGGMMDNAFLDLGQAFFFIGYLAIIFFFPNAFVLEGIILGLSAASKFWSTTIILVALMLLYRVVIRKDKLNIEKILISTGTAFLVFALTYAVSFIKSGGTFNIFAFLGRDLKFMLTHNSSNLIGGSIILFITGYFAPWWTAGVERAKDWFLLWPAGILSSLVMLFQTKAKNLKFYFYLLPFIYLVLISTGVPFTRYFILILPFIYLGLADFLFGSNRQK